MFNINTIIGILIPFLGTSLGAGCVFLLKKDMKRSMQNLLLGFASGVMVAASVWSLLIPSIDMSESFGKFSFLPAAIGFILGILFLLLLDKLIPHMHIDNSKEGMESSLKKSTMLVLAVTLHNIPEGMAVGVVFSGFLTNSAGITLAGAIALSVGIAIQNFPEGAVISMPIINEGVSKKKAFSYGVLSGIVEPIGAFITILLSSYIVSFLPYLLSFAAGAMIYGVVEELIPEAQLGEHSDSGTLGVMIGFLIMMILDIA